jgi:hypothetical protein
MAGGHLFSYFRRVLFHTLLSFMLSYRPLLSPFTSSSSLSSLLPSTPLFLSIPRGSFNSTASLHMTAHVAAGRSNALAISDTATAAPASLGTGVDIRSLTLLYKKLGRGLESIRRLERSLVDLADKDATSLTIQARIEAAQEQRDLQLEQLSRNIADFTA